MAISILVAFMIASLTEVGSQRSDSLDFNSPMAPTLVCRERELFLPPISHSKVELPAPWYFDPISFQAIAVFLSSLEEVGVSLREFIRLFRASSLLPTVLLYLLNILVRIVGLFLLTNAQGFHLLGC